MANAVKVIGIGPGSAEYLTQAALKALEEADVLVGGERLLVDWAKPHQATKAIKSNLVEVVSFIKEVKDIKQVVVLASGDPGMFGILNFLLKYFAKEELEVIPGLSSVQMAAARLKTSWHDGIIFSVHGRSLDGLVETLKVNPKAFILTDPNANPARIARILLDARLTKKATVCANLSYPTEEIKVFSLEELAAEEKYKGCILVLEDN